MTTFKKWANILATVNIIVLFTIWIVIISLYGFLTILTIKWYYFLILFSSLSIYLRRVEIATVLQIIGCLIQGVADPFIAGSGQYSTDVSNLLTAIINRSTGLYPEDFAKQYLFEPLGIPDEDWGWYKDYEGINWGGSGLCMNRTSMAKIAYLCLREGNWNGTQILSQEYIQKATTDFDGMISDVYQPYGYSIWLNNYTTNVSWYYASGAFGQNFYVISELDLIVLFNAWSTIGTNQTQILTDYIIPSIIIEEAGEEEEEEETPPPPPIPGYEPLIVIGATIIVYIGIVVVKKKKL